MDNQECKHCVMRESFAGLEKNLFECRNDSCKQALPSKAVAERVARGVYDLKFETEFSCTAGDDPAGQKSCTGFTPTRGDLSQLGGLRPGAQR